VGKFLTALALGAFLFTQSQTVFAKVEPGVAGVASIVPGLGQTLNGDGGEGLLWFTTIAAGLSFSPRGAWPASAFMHLWMYNIYDAYRDAGAKRSAKYTVFQNYFAAFNPMNIIDPIGAPIVIVPAVTGGKSSGPKLASSPVLAPIEIAFIGLGEEGLFRGFFFPAFSDLTGSAIIGAVTSSLLFAYAHRFYSGQSKYALQGDVFASRAIGGALFCLQTYLHSYDLRHSIFAHTWYDVIVDYKHAGGTIAHGPLRTTESNSGQPRISGFVVKYVHEF